MSIISKYVTTATMVNRQKQLVDHATQEQESTFSEDSLQLQAETRWWRWQWLRHKQVAEENKPAEPTNPGLNYSQAS
ncbi:MAG: hypothetical protein U0175_26685 [Caldilineaceae bacterium]